MKFKYDSELVQDNIKEIWETLSLCSYLEGKNWYWEAHNICQDIADEFNIPIDVVCGVMAAMSPQKSWNENIKLCKRYCENSKDFKGHVRGVISKAHIISMYSTSYKDRKAFIERMLKGDKIVNFFNNILNPYDRSWVTIDRHHIQICTGLKIETVTYKQYDFLKEETIKFAKTVNLIPCELQSILWIHFRKTKKGGI